MRPLLPSCAFVGVAMAQGAAYSQCGGIGWTGATSCVSGYTCTYLNAYYSQCLPGPAKPPTTSTSLRTSTTSVRTTATATTRTATPTTATSAYPTSTGTFRWFGVNQAGPEFGGGLYPGVWGKDFTFPVETSIKTLMGQGFNTFRFPFSMERLAPNQLTGAFDAGYLANLTRTVDLVTGRGGYAVLDAHNFGRYRGSIISDTAGFGAFWARLAGAFRANGRVLFDTNNEFHDEDQDLVRRLNQAAIDAIRAAGATEQYILVEGNSWSGAWTWDATNDNLKTLTDPSARIVYEMHQYLDADGSGTSETCVTAEIGLQRVTAATAWLRRNGKQGLLGEYAGGANPVCLAAVKGMLDHLRANADVWTGALWWAAGPWWNDYLFSFEPSSGKGYAYYDALLRTYVP